MADLLVFDNVSFVYHSKEHETIALENLNFSLEKEDFVSIVGPSGCGKTTILSLIAGLLKPSNGNITLSGKQISSTENDIGYMFQQDNLFDWLTVESNILLGLKIKKELTTETKAFALNLLQKYGLSDFKTHYPTELSGGMRQRVALIRTLATNPQLLLLDEPFSALDYQTRINIQNIVHKIIKSEHKTVILVTHDISEAIALSDRVLILTNRPAQIKTDLKLDFEKDLTPFQRRSDPNFNLCFNKIWKELQQ